jgi:hypothetical protein
MPDDLHKLVSKDIRPLVKKALKAGWTLERTGSARATTYAQLRSPGGFETIPLPRQGGALNRIGNEARKALRRHGIT